MDLITCDFCTGKFFEWTESEDGTTLGECVVCKHITIEVVPILSLVNPFQPGPKAAVVCK